MKKEEWYEKYRGKGISMYDFMSELDGFFDDYLETVLYFYNEDGRVMYCLTKDDYALSVFLTFENFDEDANIDIRVKKVKQGKELMQLREFVIEALTFLFRNYYFEQISEEAEADEKDSDEEVLLKFIEKKYEEEFERLKEAFSEEELFDIAREVVKNIKK